MDDDGVEWYVPYICDVWASDKNVKHIAADVSYVYGVWPETGISFRAPATCRKLYTIFKNRFPYIGFPSISLVKLMTIYTASHFQKLYIWIFDVFGQIRVLPIYKLNFSEIVYMLSLFQTRKVLILYIRFSRMPPRIYF